MAGRGPPCKQLCSRVPVYRVATLVTGYYYTRCSTLSLLGPAPHSPQPGPYDPGRTIRDSRRGH